MGEEVVPKSDYIHLYKQWRPESVVYCSLVSKFDYTRISRLKPRSM